MAVSLANLSWTDIPHHSVEDEYRRQRINEPIFSSTSTSDSSEDDMADYGESSDEEEEIIVLHCSGMQFDSPLDLPLPTTYDPPQDSGTNFVLDPSFSKENLIHTITNQLPAEKLAGVIDIVSESIAITTSDSGEVEFDLTALDDLTLCRLNNYVNECTLNTGFSPPSNDVGSSGDSEENMLEDPSTDLSPTSAVPSHKISYNTQEDEENRSTWQKRMRNQSMDIEKRLIQKKKKKASLLEKNARQQEREQKRLEKEIEKKMKQLEAIKEREREIQLQREASREKELQLQRDFELQKAQTQHLHNAEREIQKQKESLLFVASPSSDIKTSSSSSSSAIKKKKEKKPNKSSKTKSTPVKPIKPKKLPSSNNSPSSKTTSQSQNSIQRIKNTKKSPLKKNKEKNREIHDQIYEYNSSFLIVNTTQKLTSINSATPPTPTKLQPTPTPLSPNSNNIRIETKQGTLFAQEKVMVMKNIELDEDEDIDIC